MTVIAEAGAALPEGGLRAERKGFVYAAYDSAAPFDAKSVESIPGVIRVRIIA